MLLFTEIAGPLSLITGALSLYSARRCYWAPALLLGVVGASLGDALMWFAAGLWLGMVLRFAQWLDRRRVSILLARDKQRLHALERADMSKHYQAMPSLTRILHVTPPGARMCHLCEACSVQYSRALQDCAWEECECTPGRWCQQMDHAQRMMVTCLYGDQPSWSVLPWQA